jgi:hypothetical protein
MTMTRASIEKKYRISRTGRILSKGKYYGNSVYIPYFFTKHKIGALSAGTYKLPITTGEMTLFPELFGLTLDGSKPKKLVIHWTGKKVEEL